MTTGADAMTPCRRRLVGADRKPPLLAGSCRDQNNSFRLNWMLRSALFPVTRPNDPLVGFVVGLVRFGWFGKLNASARNCTRVPLGAPTVLNSAMSQLCVCGPRTGLRPALPNVPAAGRVKAAVLNQ